MFHLVGSRFYGTHRPDSDYDYIAANTPENHRYCVQLGLKKLDSKYERYFGHGIDVCLVPNLELSLYARDELAKVEGVQRMTKQERHAKLKEFISKGSLNAGTMG